MHLRAIEIAQQRLHEAKFALMHCHTVDEAHREVQVENTSCILLVDSSWSELELMSLLFLAYLYSSALSL